MPLMELPEFSATIRPGHAVLGLDLGERTIGVASSDRGQSLATPVETIERRKLAGDLQRLSALAKERDAKAFILGLPLNMDGTKGPRVQITQSFAHEILKAAKQDSGLFNTSDPAILMWDERLSTSAVDRFLIGEADLSRAKRAAVVDKMAASYILQGALDALANLRQG
ncbi:MAG: Holliday junction resolvase RuvX [Pseudomonadota bacterium]